jgi:hypothetical protein
VQENVSVLHSVQTGSGAHTVSYAVGTGGSCPGGKKAEREADIKNGGAVPAFSYMSSWRST